MPTAALPTRLPRPSAGVAVSLLRVLTKATLPGTEEGLRRSTNIYFSVAALVCAGSTALYGLVLPRLPAAQRYRRAALDAALHLSDGEGEGGGGSGIDGSTGAAAQPAWKLVEQQQEPQQHAAGWPGGQEVELAHSSRLPQQHCELAGEALLRPGQPHASDSRAWLQPGLGGSSYDGIPAGAGAARLSSAAVLRCIWRLALANALIYTVTLSIFPGEKGRESRRAG